MKKFNLNIGHWNVHGLNKDKLEDPEFQNNVNNFDILCVTESWTHKDSRIKLNGFDKEPFHKPASRNALRKGRSSGGLLIYFKKEIKNGIKLIKISQKHNVIWFKLCSDFFGLSRDLYIGATYIRPERIKNSENAFVEIEQDLARYNNLGHIMLIGDFNARIKNLPDYIVNDETDFAAPDHIQYIADFELPRRSFTDQSINNHGKALSEFCISTGMRILNGRTLGDLVGYQTFFGHQGSSTIDYILSHQNNLKLFLSMCISDPNEFSDHCIISCRVACNLSLNTPTIQNKHSGDKSISLSCKKWNQIEIRKFRDSLISGESLQAINECLEINCHDKSKAINDLVSKCNGILLKAAYPNFGNKLQSKRKQKSKFKKNWMDRECWELRRELKSMARKIHTQPEIKGQFILLKRQYKKLCKHKAWKCRNEFLNKLENLDESKDTRGFWREFKKLGLQQNDNNINSEMWVNHFTNLCNNKESIEGLQDLPDPELLFHDTKTILDYEISELEIRRAIKRLKNGKAVGPDLIQNEMIKYGHEALSPVIKKLFNLILEHGIFPDSWSQSHLITIFKSGDIDSPGDYRGICISSCLSKLFTSILNDRLYDFMNDKLSIYQAGFKRQHRTSDHIFTLNTLVRKCLRKKHGSKKLYTCFVDFSKAFDALWRPFILEKLFSKSVGGKFYTVIKQMLISTKANVKLPHLVTDYFAMTLGIKQGDPISPTLFNIFLDDLVPCILNSNGDHPSLNNTVIPLLMYADDVVLISESPEGLQLSLNALNNYCKTWRLNVNLKKTKIVVFENRRSLAPVFLLGNNVIARVDEYKYLGIIFSYTGNFKAAQIDLYKKALKALFGIHGKINFHSINPILAKKLFSSLIRPILTYGSEVWGADLIHLLNGNLKKLDAVCCEKLLNKFCKMSLGVNKKSINCAVRRELACYPVCIEIFSSMLKFDNRLAELNENWLVREAYLEDINVTNDADNYNSSDKTWHSAISKLHTLSDQTHPSAIKSNLMQNYQRISNTYITRSPRLQFYVACADLNYEFPGYIKLRSDLRQSFSKFRISAHNFKNLTHKYTRGQPQPGSDNCDTCNVTENETHVLFHCTKFTERRNHLFARAEEILELSHDFELLSENNQIEYLFKTENITLLKETGLFLKFILDKKNRGVA